MPPLVPSPFKYRLRNASTELPVTATVFTSPPLALSVIIPKLVSISVGVNEAVIVLLSPLPVKVKLVGDKMKILLLELTFTASEPKPVIAETVNV